MSEAWRGHLSFNSTFPQLIHHAGSRQPPLHVFLIPVMVPGLCEPPALSGSLAGLGKVLSERSSRPPYTTVSKALFKIRIACPLTLRKQSCMPCYSNVVFQVGKTCIPHNI